MSSWIDELWESTKVKRFVRFQELLSPDKLAGLEPSKRETLLEQARKIDGIIEAFEGRLDLVPASEAAVYIDDWDTFFVRVAEVVVEIMRWEYEKRLQLSVEKFGPSAVDNKASEHVEVYFDPDAGPFVRVEQGIDESYPALERLAKAVKKFYTDESWSGPSGRYFLAVSTMAWAKGLSRNTEEGGSNDEEPSADPLGAFAPEHVGYENEHPMRALTRHLAQNYARLLEIEQMGLDQIGALLGLVTTQERQEEVPRLPQIRDELLTVGSSQVIRGLMEAIVEPDSFRRVEGNPFPVTPLGKGATRGQAMLRPPAIDEGLLLPPETVEAWAREMWRQRGELTDLDADALDALSHVWLHQAKDRRDGAITGVDILLEMRQIKKKRGGSGRRGGYEAGQRADMLRALHRIQNIWLEVDEVEVYEGTRRRKPVRKSIQSRAFVVTDRMGQMRIDGSMEVEKFRFVPGEIFAMFLMGAGRQVALLSAEALKYDPEKQKREKRLARYLSWQWRTRARGEGYLQPYRVQTLLERIGEETETKRPSRLRQRLEKALDTLQRDKVIAGWQYADFDEWFNEAGSKRQGWLDAWLSATVVIEPPEKIKDEYRKGIQGPVKRAESSRRSPETSVSGDEVRTRRKALGLSQAEAAEELNINQSRLSRIESGKSKPSGELAARLRMWMVGRT